MLHFKDETKGDLTGRTMASTLTILPEALTGLPQGMLYTVIKVIISSHHSIYLATTIFS